MSGYKRQNRLMSAAQNKVQPLYACAFLPAVLLPVLSFVMTGFVRRKWPAFLSVCFVIAIMGVSVPHGRPMIVPQAAAQLFSTTPAESEAADSEMPASEMPASEMPVSEMLTPAVSEGWADSPMAGDMAAQLQAIGEALRLLNRRLDALPLGGGLPTQQAQNQAELLSRLSTIEMQVQALAAAQSAGAAAGGDMDTAGVADLRVRLNQIEEIMRNLNGQLDDIAFQLLKLGDRFEQAADDTTFRFQEIERMVGQSAGANTPTASDNAAPQILGTLSVPAPPAIQQAPLDAAPGLIGEAPLTPSANSETATTQTALAEAGDTDPLALYDEALNRLRMGGYAEAETKLRRFLSLFPGHKLAGNAQYWLGETYYVRRDYKNAASAFLAGYNSYAESRKAPDSLLKLGMTLIVLGERQTGCDAFAELAVRFPDASRSVIQRANVERQRAGCS